MGRERKSTVSANLLRVIPILLLFNAAWQFGRWQGAKKAEKDVLQRVREPRLNVSRLESGDETLVIVQERLTGGNFDHAVKLDVNDLPGVEDSQLGTFMTGDGFGGYFSTTVWSIVNLTTEDYILSETNFSNMPKEYFKESHYSDEGGLAIRSRSEQDAAPQIRPRW